jgi:hypothetical protein
VIIEFSCTNRQCTSGEFTPEHKTKNSYIRIDVNIRFSALGNNPRNPKILTLFALLLQPQINRNLSMS